MSAKIVKIVLEVSGKEIELSEDEAKELKLVLDGLYGAPLQYIPQPYPVYTPTPLPTYIPTPIFPPQPNTNPFYPIVGDDLDALIFVCECL